PNRRTPYHWRCWARPCGHSIDRLELLRGIEFPNRTSVHRRDGAQDAVHSTREEHAGNDADRGDNAAMRRHRLGVLQRPKPFFDAGGEVHRHQAVAEMQAEVDGVPIDSATEYGFARAAPDAPGDVPFPDRG